MKQKKHQKEYEEFMDKEFKKLQGHFGASMLRMVNELHRIEYNELNNIKETQDASPKSI